jgi:hypothetical protein
MALHHFPFGHLTSNRVLHHFCFSHLTSKRVAFDNTDTVSVKFPSDAHLIDSRPSDAYSTGYLTDRYPSEGVRLCRKDWIAAVSSVDGTGAAARAGIATAAAAVQWGDSEASGRALAFIRGIVHAAASPDGRGVPSSI